jgi:hypothetical protein
VDVKVRIQRGDCPPAEPFEESATRFLLRQPVERLRQVAYHRLGREAHREGLTLLVDGTLPLAPYALLVLKLDEGAETFIPGAVHLSGPAGALRVLGQGTLDERRRFSVMVERPEGHADGALYTLTLTQKEGVRRMVVERVIPWPPAPPSPQGDVLGPQEAPKGDAGGAHNRKVPGTQRLKPR